MIQGHNATVQIQDGPKLKLYTGYKMPNGSFNLEKYTEALARCKSPGHRRLLKAMAFPYLYGANSMTATQDPSIEILDETDVHPARTRPPHPRNDMHTATIRESAQSRVHGSTHGERTAESVSQGRTDDDSDFVIVEMFRFGTARMDVDFIKMGFDFLRINDETHSVELGVDHEVFSYPCHCLEEAEAVFNQTLGTLSTFMTIKFVN